ncbi:MAG: GGDEF domain-containing protein [Candidatus Cloacimonadaceae bacterium]
MAQTAKSFALTDADKQALQALVQDFCQQPAGKKTDKIIAVLKQHLTDFAASNNNHKHAIGLWVYNFLTELAPHLKMLKQDKNCQKTDLITYLMNVPCDECNEFYAKVLATIKPEEITPLTPKKYLFLLQTVFILIELSSNKSSTYLSELTKIMNDKSSPSLHILLVRMLKTKAECLAGQELENQFNWLDLVLTAWKHIDRCTTEYFLIQWVLSIGWLRPNSIRKEILTLLLESVDSTDKQNTSILLYELFSLPDKSVTTGEKLNYLSRLQAMPSTLFKVRQLQNIYYFSGSIKSSLVSGFMESVTDFQNSNYYIHKYWNWIGRINQFFLKNFSSEEYLELQANIELITKELISLINIQSNAYVETLQSNYKKINDLYHQVEELSLRDSLTGLHNRRFLYNNINELLQLAVRQQSPLSMVIIDIDDFKPINDNYGHLAGDKILAEMSTILRNFFRKSDFVIRYGGEEFLIVMFNSDHLQAEQALDKLRIEMMEHTFKYERAEIHLTISIGIASCVFETPYSAVHLEKLISEADSAMYDSKSRGKNKITSKVIYY